MTPHPGCSSSGDAERGASTMSFCTGFLLGVHGSRAEFESLSTATALLVFVQFTRMLWLDVLFDSCLENTQEDHGWGSADENWPTETAGNGGGCLAFIDSDRGAETRHPSNPGQHRGQQPQSLPPWGWVLAGQRETVSRYRSEGTGATQRRRQNCSGGREAQ